MNKFKFLEHTADIKFLVYGANLDKIFENSALAFSEYVSEKNIKSKLKRKIEISAKNEEQLLYVFLDELIYLIDAHSFLVAKAKVKIKNNKLLAVLEGDDASKYSIKHVKAATYSEMKIEKKDKTWQASIVLDV